jgi:hypothetical protein
MMIDGNEGFPSGRESVRVAEVTRGNLIPTGLMLVIASFLSSNV